MKRLGALILLPLTLAGTSAIRGLDSGTRPPLQSPDLTVHEWGTFTSVAGPAGQAVEWTPFSGPSDLPCFVTILNPTSIKVGPKGYLPSIKATVRMETPVIYFYSGREQTVNVRVRFPHGLITEWYPQGRIPPVPFGMPLAKMTGGIAWNDVRISPLPARQFSCGSRQEPLLRGPRNGRVARPGWIAAREVPVLSGSGQLPGARLRPREAGRNHRGGEHRR